MNLFGKKTRYEQFLEDENRRLRNENRQLLNSILQVAGHGPIREQEEAPKPVKPRRKMTWFQFGLQRASEAVKQAQEQEVPGPEAAR